MKGKKERCLRRLTCKSCRNSDRKPKSFSEKHSEGKNFFRAKKRHHCTRRVFLSGTKKKGRGKKGCKQKDSGGKGEKSLRNGGRQNGTLSVRFKFEQTKRHNSWGSKNRKPQGSHRISKAQEEYPQGKLEKGN